MPTIDELAPASSASDSDEFIVSQAGTARKITRAQVLNGLQPQMSVPSESLLGNAGSTAGAPGVIAVGKNLSFNNGTLSAVASPFVIGNLPFGNVPSSGDLLAVSQGGTSCAVTYGQFASGISALPNVDITHALVSVSGTSPGQPIGVLLTDFLPLSGGTLAGNLTLSNLPSNTSHAANKGYVDSQVATRLSLTGGSVTGTLTLGSLPQQPLEAATKGYVDGALATVLPLGGGTLTGGLTLNSDPTNDLQASTKHYADQKVSRAGDTLSGALLLAADPQFLMQAATKNYVDSQVSTSLPKNGGTLTGAIYLASDPTINGQAANKQYVDQRLLRSGDTLTGALLLASDPTSAIQAATKNYVDTKFGLSVARQGSSMTGSLVLAADPAVSLEAATKQYVDLHIARNGDSFTGSIYLASDPTTSMQAATKHYVDSQFTTAVTSTGASFSGPVLLAGSPTSPLQAATQQYADTKIARAGDTLTGSLILAKVPTVPFEAATKSYADTLSAGSLQLSGGSLTGNLVLNSDPTLSAQAATKHYVDNQVATTLSLTGGSLTGALTLASAPAVPLHAATKQYVDNQLSAFLPTIGGTVSGALTLALTPTQPSQAATKGYVDSNPDSRRVINVALPPYNAKIDGVTDDTQAFKSAYSAAPPGGTIYVPNGTTVLQSPGSWGIALTKRVQWIVSGTVLNDGTPLASAIPTGGGPVAFVLPGFVSGNTPSGITTSQGASQTTDFAVSQSSYIVNHSGGSAGAVISNVRADTIIYSSPGNYVWGGLDRLIWAGTQTPVAATAAQHVGRYIQTLRQAATASSSGSFLPQPQMWGACIEYRDTTGQPSSATNASLTIEMDWFGNGLDDANCRTIQSLVIGQHNTSGPPVEVANIIGVYLSGGSSGSAKTVFGIGVPFSNAVLDTTYAQAINSAPAIKLAAGQAIAFEATNSNRLLYDSTSNTLRWNQGTLSYPVGKGITVGWVNVYSATTTLPNYVSGNLIFLVGNSPYSINLPAANSVAAGTGFTFTVTGSAPVSIVPHGSDNIDNGPISLNTNDRYHIVSDGVSFWHEIFRTNYVTPHFSGPITLASYSVAGLPGGQSPGAKAFASNGRKPTEGAGAGSGVEVFFDGQHWISSCSGSVVAS